MELYRRDGVLMVGRRRLFTLAEALEILPVVRQILKQIQDNRDDLEKSSAVLEALLLMATAESDLKADIDKAQRSARLAAREIESRLSELDALGAEIKDVDAGLVDFPCEREGRVVYLCWRLGEETIAWWHELDTGFGGRKPLD